jgi:two-component system cell cycle sensor histidine kinase/response regulator CckA
LFLRWPLENGRALSSGCADNPQHRKYAEQIRKAAESSAGLTRQLVAFSRKRSSEIKGLELNAVIRELQQILLHLLGKKIKLRIISHEREVWVEADRNHLEQIIVNLVVNARDAMPNGGVLEIESFIQEVDDGKLPPGRYAGLRVTDTGHGIDPEIRSQLFQPFFSTKGDHGTGWGLATVARVVEQSGGDVRVQSAVGLGSTFTVLLREAPARIEPAALRAVQRQGCESILVVDDEAAIRMASREFLSAQGYKVTEAATAIEALTFLQRHVQPVDLIVTELNMPVMSGLELADQARQIQPGLPVLFISGSVDAGFQQQLAELREKSACIQKPFALTTLVNNIRRLLDGSDSNRQLNE